MTSKTITLHRLSLAHHDLLAALHAQGFDDPWSAKTFAELLILPAVWGWLAVTSEDQPVGFILCQGDDIEAEVLTLMTHKTYRRQGIATQLIGYSTSHTNRLFLEVARDNPTAEAFYHAQNFKQIGQRRHYYKRASGARVDALVLCYERP